jgi:RNA polymerase sigma factor (sigma-70 family)
MAAKDLYLEHLRSIESIAGWVARRHRLDTDETAEFVQEVCFRLLDNDYSVIRKFEGRASITTYLTTVIGRLFNQYRVERWGKWRPSAEAKRLGDKAITLERLITRDGYTFDEAVKILTTPGGSQYTVGELEAIYLRLPNRGPRPVMVSGDIAPDIIATDGETDERVARKDREFVARKVVHSIDAVMMQVDPEDRLILQLRFFSALKVPEIARRLHHDQKWLYKRLEMLFAKIRRKMEADGLDQKLISDLLNAQTDLKFGFLRDEQDLTAAGPSNRPRER